MSVAPKRLCLCAEKMNLPRQNEIRLAYHFHMLASIPPKYSVSQFMGYPKGKGSLMILHRYVNLGQHRRMA